MRWFESEIEERYEATGGGLEIIADVLQKGLEDSKRFGFAFIHIATEGGGCTGIGGGGVGWKRS